MPPPTTLPELLADAIGLPRGGPHRCLFCGAAASEPYSLPDSFTTRDILRCPGSQHACRGCLACLEEVGEACYPDGVRYAFTKAYRRMLSHVITPTSVVQATKGHLGYLRSVCLTPPEPPFAISIAVSGQKHVLFRGIVCRSRASVSLTLEGERVNYRPADLAARLALCGRIVAATGKPALAEPPATSLWFRVCERYTAGESLCAEWERVREEPLSRLAAFLTPAKESCADEYPSDRDPGSGGVPAASGGASRPEPPADRRSRKRVDQGGGNATLFDAL